MARLQEGCEVFLASLEKAVIDLDTIRESLERHETSEGVNTLQLIHRIHKLTKKVQEVAGEAAVIATEREAVVQSLDALLSHNVMLVQELQRKSGLDDNEDCSKLLETSVREYADITERLRGC